MDSLFAPWRIEWVKRDVPPDEADHCVFCELRESTTDRDDLIVARAPDAYVVLNNYPYNPGHVMVIPHAHNGRMQELSEGQLHGFAEATQATVRAIELAFEPDGINTGCNLGSAAAGGSITEHLHRHILPRWRGDTNFMPIISETKVIVQALSDTYAMLHDAFSQLDEATVSGSDDAVWLRQD